MPLTGTISINGSQRTLADAEPNWLANQINGRKHDGQTICLHIRLEQPVALTLATQGCGLSGGSGASRPYTPKENQVIALWHECGMGEPDLKLGHVMQFLRRLESV